MTQTPAGWYPDPQPPHPGQPPQQRYWDGATWTTHVAPLVAPPEQPGPYGGFGQAAAYDAGGRATTPDGQPLAGWWQRVAAILIDGLLIGLVGALLALPWWRDVVDAFRDYVHDAIRASDAGVDPPSSAEFQRHIAVATAAIAVINLAVSFVYTVGFLSWKQATLGKLALGLRVRRRDDPGLPLSTILLRWAGQTGIVGVIGLVPFVGGAGSLYSLLDSLWPLWDDKRQALHDKVAGTNVVRRRP